jgi:hypothetical protein
MGREKGDTRMAAKHRKRARTPRVDYGKRLWTLAVGSMLVTAWLTSSEIQASEEFGGREIASVAVLDDADQNLSEK